MTNQTRAHEPEAAKDSISFIREVWYGQRSLAQTFWLWNLLLADLVVWYGGGLLALTLAMITYRMLFIYLFWVISISISVWVWVGLWRAAAMKSDWFWSLVIRGYIVVGIVGVVAHSALGAVIFNEGVGGPMGARERQVYNLLQDAVDEGQRRINLGETITFPWHSACFFEPYVSQKEIEKTIGYSIENFPTSGWRNMDNFYSLVLLEAAGSIVAVRLQLGEFEYIGTHGVKYGREYNTEGECVSRDQAVLIVPGSGHTPFKDAFERWF